MMARKAMLRGMEGGAQSSSDEKTASILLYTKYIYIIYYIYVCTPCTKS